MRCGGLVDQGTFAEVDERIDASKHAQTRSADVDDGQTTHTAHTLQLTHSMHSLAGLQTNEEGKK